MKTRITLFALAVSLALAGCTTTASNHGGGVFGALPQFHPPVAFTSNIGCSGVSNFGNAELCYDATANFTPYYWAGSSGFLAASISPTPTTVVITGTNAAVVPLTVVGASAQSADLVDIDTSGPTIVSKFNSAGAFTTSSATLTATGDKALNVSNGGHISNPIGTGTPPTSGTGTITAGGTDSAFTCTGGTSPVTVTFGTAFAVAPSCGCSDITSATALKAVPGTGTVVVTTTGTDSFSCVCVGH